MTSTTNTLALLQPSKKDMQTMNMRTCAHFDDEVLMAMITSALESGVRSMKEFANLHSITLPSLKHWVGQNGRPGWKELKNMHPLTACKKNKKRKAVVEKQTKNKK
jgi:hypothetical protein